MKLITQGFIVLVFCGSCLGLPQPANDDDDATTVESIDNIFRKYDQEYPFHGGNSNDGSNVQSDAPAVEAILERLNGIITDDRPNGFSVPNAESSEEQRSLLRKQYKKLIFGPSRINRRVKEAKNRANDENVGSFAGFVDFDQTGFFNKDSWTENYNTQEVDRLPGTTTRRTPVLTQTQTSRIPVPVRTSTRFPARQTTTTEAPINPDRETFIDLVEDEILEKPEGNKLSIPVLSVATEDFEEDLPQKPVSPMRPNKLTAQTEDFDASRSQFDNHNRRQSTMFRKRRETSSMEWLVSRVASLLNFYGEPEVAEEGRKMSTLSKRQITEDLIGDVIPPAIPIPEEVKSVDVPTQVSDAVIETIQDIADPQTRNEFTKDVPAIEDKLDEIEEKEEAKQTVEVAVVELGQTEAESLGRIIEADPIGDALNDSRQVIIEPETINTTDLKVEMPKSLDLIEIPIQVTEEEKKPEVVTKVLRDQIPDDSSRSGAAPPAKIVDIIAAIPSEVVSVMAPTETIRDVPETARKIELAAVNNAVVVPVEDDDDNDEKLSYIEVERLVPMIKSQTQKTVTLTTISEIKSTIVPEVPVKETVRAEVITEVKAVEDLKPKTANPISIAHTTMLVEDKVVPEGDHEPLLKKIILETDIVSGQPRLEVKSTESVPIQPTGSLDGRSALEVKGKELAKDVALEEPTLTVGSADIPSIKISAVPQIKSPIVDQEQDFEIVIEPEAEDEPSPKSLDLNVTTTAPEVIKIEVTTPTVVVPLKEVKDHIVEETVLLTDNTIVPTRDNEVRTVDDPNVPLISESVDSRLNSMIIAEVMEDENMELGFNAAHTTILPLDWLKEDFSGKDESTKSRSDSGSNSNSISTTESTSEWESKTTPLGSSEEMDSKEDEGKILRKQEKKRLEEEAKRLKEEKKLLLKEEKERKKALLGDKSSEEEEGHDEQRSPSNRVELITKFIEPEAREKFTKEEMVNLFSSPEMDIDPRILTTTAEVVPTPDNPEEAAKNISSDHTVIKKDRVEIQEEKEDDDSEESDEVTTLVIPNELMDKLAEELDQERETVAKVLTVLEHAIDDAVRQDAENMIDTGSQQQREEVNTVISSKNTRHLAKMGYSEDEYVEKDIAMGDQEARLSDVFMDGDEPEGSLMNNTSRAFLLGSALFLIIGFVLFALVVLIIKRTRRYGSMDLTIQA